MANRILGHEFQQGRIVKVIPALKADVLTREGWMLLQVNAQTGCVSLIQKIYGAAEPGIFNSLVVWQIQLIGASWFFNMPLQPRPAGEAGLTRDGELGIAQAQPGREDLGVSGPAHARMKFPDSLRGFGKAGVMISEQVLGLILQMIKVGIGWQASYRHNELPFLRPRSACMGRKSVREAELLLSGGLLSFPRTGCALLR